MNTQLWIGVYRRLDNRAEGLSDDSPRAVELHNRRKHALHDALDSSPVWKVEKWGYTDDDTRTHEFVELATLIISDPTFQSVAIPALGYIGGKLLEIPVDMFLIDPIKELINRLRGKQKQEGIQDFHVRLPDGTTIRCDPADEDAILTLQLRDGKHFDIKYSATQEEIDELTSREG
jgi:hypothetical protein